MRGQHLFYFVEKDAIQSLEALSLVPFFSNAGVFCMKGINSERQFYKKQNALSLFENHLIRCFYAAALVLPLQ